MMLPVMSGSMLFWSAPNRSWAPFSSRNETPMAVIRSESLGALLRGVYATFSTRTPSMVLTEIASTIATTGGNANEAMA